MKAVSIDLTRRDNFRLTFDAPVEVFDATTYVAEVYKRALAHDETLDICVERPLDCVRDSNDEYTIVDHGRNGRSLFLAGELTKQPPKTDHFFLQYHASNAERDLLINELEKLIQ